MPHHLHAALPTCSSRPIQQRHPHVKAPYTAAVQIAIMAEGELQCCGPSLELKQRYSQGYVLSLTTALTSAVDYAGIHALITAQVPSSSLLRRNGAELVYRLPMNQMGRYAGGGIFS